MLKTLKKRLNNQRGLTLVELLAVIVILGIISAIAVPSIGNIIENSKKDAAVADAIQIINAAKIAHAANPNQTTWTHTGSTAGTDYLKDYLTGVEDTVYTVTLENNTYSITGHESAAKALDYTGDAVGTTALSESALIAKTK